MENILIKLIKIMKTLGKGNQKDKILPVSIFHMIVWIFVVDKQLNEEQEKRINDLYGVNFETFNPIARDLKRLTAALNCIKTYNPKCIVNIVVNKTLLQAVRQYTKQNKQISIICGLTKDDEIKQSLPNSQSNIRKSQSIVNTSMLYTKNLNNFIDIASKEVKLFTNRFRVFDNSQCLVGDYVTAVNTYRYKLIACIKMKLSDFIPHTQIFAAFAKKQIINRNKLIQNMVKTEQKMESYHQFQSIIISYQKEINFIVETKIKEKKLEKENVSDHKKNNEFGLLSEQFCHKIISYYQSKGFFYKLINNYLRSSIHLINCQWVNLSVPFSNMYNSIKYLFKAGRQKQPLFYSVSSFEVWRAGKINKKQKQKYQNYENLKIFIEFFGFVSTSLDIKIAVNHLLKNKNNKDSFEEDDNESFDCLFKINCKNNEKLLQDKYDFLLHGYYKFGKQQKQGDIQKEVIFNALNVFQLKSIKKMKMSEALGKEYQQMMPDRNKTNEADYNQNQNKYNADVYVIQLEYGPFTDIILEQKTGNLSEYQKSVKATYLCGMNKIKQKQNQFDFADVYVFNRQMKEAQQYLQKKVESTQWNLIQDKDDKIFQISKLDNQNYFARLAQLYDKRGLGNKAMKFLQLTIKCKKHIEVLDISVLEKNHFNQLFLMQEKLFSIFSAYNNDILYQNHIQKSLEDYKKEKNKKPSIKIHMASLKMNLSLNKFSVGKVGDSIVTLKKALNSLVKLKNVLEMNDINQKCVCFDFLKNLYSGGQGKTWNYCAFKQIMHKNLIEKRKKQLGAQQIIKNQMAANSMIAMAYQILMRQKKLFKDPHQYEKLIKQYKSKLNYEKYQDKHKDLSEQLKMEYQLRDIIQQLRKLQPSSQQYQHKLKQFNNQYKEFLQKKNQSNKFNQFSDCNFVDKFIEDQKIRKLQAIQNQRKKVILMQMDSLKEQYERYIDELQKFQKELEKEGYSFNSIKNIQSVWKKTEASFSFGNYDKALKNIEQIIDSSNREGEQRPKQLAKAYLIKGKIFINQQKYNEAVDILLLSIEQFQIHQNTQTNQSIFKDEAISNDASSIHSQFIHSNHKIANIVQSQQNLTDDYNKKIMSNTAWGNQKYIEAHILLCKAKLFSQDALNKNNQKKNKVTKYDKINKCGNYSINGHKFQVGDILEVLETVVKKKCQIFKMNEIQADFYQLQGNYNLRTMQNWKYVQMIFKPFEKSLKLRRQAYGQKNFQNAVMCAQIIYNFYNLNDLVKEKIVKNNYKQIIDQIYQQSKNQYFFAKLTRAKIVMGEQLKDMDQTQVNMNGNQAKIQQQNSEQIKNQKQSLSEPPLLRKDIIINQSKIEQKNTKIQDFQITKQQSPKLIKKQTRDSDSASPSFLSKNKYKKQQNTEYKYPIADSKLLDSNDIKKDQLEVQTPSIIMRRNKTISKQQKLQKYKEIKRKIKNGMPLSPEQQKFYQRILHQKEVKKKQKIWNQINERQRRKFINNESIIQEISESKVQFIQKEE